MAQATRSRTPTPTRAAPSRPQGATAEAAAVQDQAREQQPVDTGDIIVTATAATRRCPTCRWRSARSPPRRSVTPAQPTSVSCSRSRHRCSSRRPRPKPARRVARIRGVGTVGDNPGLESSVGVFIDGVYRSRTGVGLTELGPIDRIEVLRGPQGTLFGRNASAGLISIITAKPRFTPECRGQVDIGNYDYAPRRGAASPARSATPSRPGSTASG